MKRLLGDEMFMKRYIKYVAILLSIAAVLTVSAVVRSHVMAAEPGQVGNAPRCTVESIGPRDSAFNVQGTRATVNFRVFGPNNCKVQVSTMAFYAQSISGKPYDKQILFDKNTRTYTPGRYSLG